MDGTGPRQEYGAVRIGLIGVVLAGFWLRMHAIGAQSLWIDEAFSLWLAAKPVPELLNVVARIDHHPPLYYLLLHGWLTVLPVAITAARLLSALLSSAAIPLLAVAGARLIGPRGGLLAALLLAVAPFQIRYAQDARMYALVTLGAAVWLAAVVIVLRSARPRRGAWIALVVGQVVAMLSHNVAAVLLTAAGNLAILVAWWVGRRPAPATAAQRRDGVTFPALTRAGFVRAWVWSQVAALLLWSPWAWAYVRQARTVDAGFWIDAPSMPALRDALTALTVGPLPLWWPLAWLWPLAALLLVGWGAWRLPRSAALWLAGLWSLPLILALLASLRRPVFYDRTLLWVTLPLLLMLAAGLLTLPRRHWRAVALALLLALNGLGLWAHFAETEKEQWDAATAVVTTHAAPGELVLFHASWTQLPFDYYAGDVELVRRGIPVDLFARGELEPKMLATDVGALRDLVAGRPVVWLIYSHWWYTDPELLVPATLEAVLTLRDEWSWPGIVVRRYAAR